MYLLGIGIACATPPDPNCPIYDPMVLMPRTGWSRPIQDFQCIIENIEGRPIDLTSDIKYENSVGVVDILSSTEEISLYSLKF